GLDLRCVAGNSVENGSADRPGRGSGRTLSRGLMFSHTHIPFRQFPRLFPVVTVLFSVQAVFFLVMTLLGETQYIPNLIRFGALERHLVSTGEWWRLVVPIFIHIGLFHFLFNSFALYLFGPQLEWLFGRISFLFLYLRSEERRVGTGGRARGLARR